MKSITYSTARAELAETMNKVCEDHNPIIITRANAKPVVMVSLEDYEAMEETNYLVRNPINAARLAAAVEEIEAMIADKKNKKKKK